MKRLYFFVAYCMIILLQYFAKIHKGVKNMPGDKKPTNRVLILIAVALCLFFGATLTQSSAEPSSRRQEMPDMFVADDNGTFPFASNVSQGQETSGDPSSVNTEETVSPTPAPTATPVPTITPIYQVSPEASRGVWTSSGSSWLFMVDGVPYTGWLTDTDGNRYYFNEDGIMQTGWLDDGNKRYYLDQDGIMQTGDIEVDGETYHLREDGSLQGYRSEENSSSKDQ